MKLIQEQQCVYLMVMTTENTGRKLSNALGVYNDAYVSFTQLQISPISMIHRNIPMMSLFLWLLKHLHNHKSSGIFQDT